MEDQVLAYESPLYGRRTGQIHLQLMDYRETAAFNPGLDSITNAMIYGITGGIPLYIQQLDVKKDLRSALLRNFFNPASYLFEESENLLRQELREPGKYNAIIKAIAEGAATLGNISSKTGIEIASCTAYIKTLVDLGIIRKEPPLGQKDFEDLKHYSGVFSPEAAFYYYMFSISGFTAELKALRDLDVKLISIDQMCKV